MQNRYTQLLLVTILLLFVAPIISKQKIGGAYIPRSQSLNGPRKIAGEIPGVNTHVYMPERTPWSEYDTFMLGPFPYQKQRIQSFVSITPEYQHSFWPSGITQALFGQRAPIKIQGSAVPNRDSRAWLADNFYLPDTFVGMLGSHATIASFIVDINAYIGLPMLREGAYCRIYAPLVHTRWNLAEKHNNRHSIGAMRGGRMSPDTIAHDQLLANALSYFGGTTPSTISQSDAMLAGADASTIIRHPLRYGNIASHACSGMTRTGFAEIRGEFGCDFWQDDYYHVGFYLAGALPTGTKPNPHYVFAPTIGNGKQFEIGGGITGHWIFWHTPDDEHLCGIFMDAMATHLCGSRREYQAFDLKNNPMSRYMLAARHEKLDPPGGDHALGGDENAFLGFYGVCYGTATQFPQFVQMNRPDKAQAHYHYAREVMPVANLTAENIQVHTPVQMDATFWFNYAGEKITIDFGYNLWVQARTNTKELLCEQNKKKLMQEHWALMGSSNLYGYVPSITAYNCSASLTTNLVLPTAHGKAVALAASQSKATIRTSGNPADGNTNVHADNAANFAFAQTNPIAWPSTYFSPPEQPFWPDGWGPQLIPPGVSGVPFSPLVDFEHKNITTNLDDTRIHHSLDASSMHISIDPLFIRPDIIDSDLSSSISISHTLFANVGYTWGHAKGESYLGLGGSIEFGASGVSYHSQNTALSQWGLWLKYAFIGN